MNEQQERVRAINGYLLRGGVLTTHDVDIDFITLDYWAYPLTDESVMELAVQHLLPPEQKGAVKLTPEDIDELYTQIQGKANDVS